MNDGMELRSERLLLRRWQAADREPFATLNADPRVMQFLGTPLSADQSDSLLDSIEARFETQGFGFWALELLGDGSFIGMAGLNIPRFDAPFMPAVEIGWRLDPQYWGHGYATEAARAVLALAFGSLGLEEIVAFTAAGNLRSQAVMQRLGMHRDVSDDFDHPLVQAESALRRHVLYRIKRSESGDSTTIATRALD